MSSDERGFTGDPAAEPQKPPPVQATCGLCVEPLMEGRDDIYAELCALCAQRQLKGRQREKRRPRGRARNEGGVQH